MSVEFNEHKPIDSMYQPNRGGFAGWLIKKKLAKDEKGAQVIMIILTILCFALSFYFFAKAL